MMEEPYNAHGSRKNSMQCYNVKAIGKGKCWETEDKLAKSERANMPKSSKKILNLFSIIHFIFSEHLMVNLVTANVLSVLKRNSST